MSLRSGQGKPFRDIPGNAVTHIRCTGIPCSLLHLTRIRSRCIPVLEVLTMSKQPKVQAVMIVMVR